MHGSARLSVIIPTFNRADFLREALESVLGQDYLEGVPASGFELLVVDDGSTDETAGVAADFAPGIRYHRMEHAGVSAARNRGLALTKGELVAFLDSDDLWLPGKLSAQIAFLDSRPDAVMCCTGEIWIRNGVRVNPREKHAKSSGWVFDRFLPLCLLSLSSALFRRRLFREIGTFDEDLPACEDYDLGLRLALRHPVFFLPEPLIVKRGGHADQLSRKYWGMDRFRVHALEKLLERENLSPEQRLQTARELARKCRILINGFRKRGNTPQAEIYLEKLRRFGPDRKNERSES
jgi:glycosyltransferase involved in cell wall biosynthesis